MASEKQKEFFRELLQRKTWPEGLDKTSLVAKFDELPTPEAARWMDRALALPNGEDSGEPVPF